MKEHGGSHRGAVGICQALCEVGRTTTAAAGSTWRTLERTATRAQRRVMDSPHRRSVARFAVAVRSVPNLPSAIPAVATLGSAGRHSVGLGRRSVGAGPVGSGRSLYRRLLHGGEKGGDGVGRTLVGKGSKLMAIADCHGLPIALWVTSATPHEQKLVEATVQHRFVAEKPKRLIADRGYDSDALDDLLARQHGIELIAPHRRYRTRTHRQDRRKLRRYRRRWKIERLFAWLKNFRRLLVRWERHSNNFLGMVQLACMLILLRRL